MSNSYSPTPATGFLERQFRLREHGTDIKTEVLGGRKLLEDAGHTLLSAWAI